MSKNREENENSTQGSEIYHDTIDDQKYEKAPSIFCRVSVRYYWKSIVLSSIVFIWLLKLVNSIPEKGLRIYDILNQPPVSKASSKMWLNFLNQRFSQESLEKPIYFLMIVSILYILYIVLKAKTTQYSLNFRFLEMKQGILNQSIGTIDLVHIKDQDMHRPLIHRLLGISNLVIVSTDKTTPVLNMNGIDKEKADNFLNFIRQNAYQNSTEYWIAKDRRRRNENTKSNKRTPSNDLVLSEDDSNE